MLSPGGVEFDILRLILDRVANRHAQAFGAAIEGAKASQRAIDAMMFKALPGT